MKGWSLGFSSMALFSDNRTLASGDSANHVRIWDSETGTLSATLPGHTDFEKGIRTVAVSPDGGLIAASGRGGQSVWSAERRRLGYQLRSDAPVCVFARRQDVGVGHRVGRSC